MNRIKENRMLSFIIVALIYILVTAAGVAIYQALVFEWWLSLLIADTVATLVHLPIQYFFLGQHTYGRQTSVAQGGVCRIQKADENAFADKKVTQYRGLRLPI